jgi:hypothetical protein
MSQAANFANAARTVRAMRSTENRHENEHENENEDENERSTALVVVDQPTDILLDEFKQQVRTWMELDNIIKSLQTAMKERRLYKKHLTTKIVDFMNRYNIEDLDTREGSIRSRVSYVKSPLSQKMIREGILKYFEHNSAVGAQVAEAVFNNNRDRTEKISLRRSNRNSVSL